MLKLYISKQSLPSHPNVGWSPEGLVCYNSDTFMPNYAPDAFQNAVRFPETESLLNTAGLELPSQPTADSTNSEDITGLELPSQPITHISYHDDSWCRVARRESASQVFWYGNCSGIASIRCELSPGAIVRRCWSGVVISTHRRLLES